MVLDWYIQGGNCKEASRSRQTYMCKENSYCYEVEDGAGYRCNCSGGYTGNPYIGCVGEKSSIHVFGCQYSITG